MTSHDLALIRYALVALVGEYHLTRLTEASHFHVLVSVILCCS